MYLYSEYKKKFFHQVPLSEMDKYSDAESAAERLKSLALKDR